MEFSASITRACALRMIRTTYVRTYLRLQHYVSALRCRDKKSDGPGRSGVPRQKIDGPGRRRRGGEGEGEEEDEGEEEEEELADFLVRYFRDAF